MEPHICQIVPPYLLQGIVSSASDDVTEARKKVAERSLAQHKTYIAKRTERFNALIQPRGQRQPIHRSIVPDFLLKHISEDESADEDVRARAKRDLEHLEGVHASYQAQQVGSSTSAAEQHTLASLAAPKPSKPSQGFYRAVYDAKNDDNEDNLPGQILRTEGQKPATDGPANEAFDNAGHVLDFYQSVFNWKSIDNKNMHVLSSVHFGTDYENAFWDPEKMQMVYGDGHDFLYHFTKCLDVIGHELTHAVTEHTSPLDYQGQPGALNEHISDVFGIMVKQKVENETAAASDWLIGEGCLLPDVKGVALRSMKDPGTAYDDPRFGKDPQPADMSGYKVITEDNGGVHLYSGIPNRAFYLASVAFGGYSWEKAGQIWWKTMNSGRVPPRCTFLQFADVTVETAEELFGDDAAKTVRDAWNQVGVVRKGH
ncbi:zincin [Thozetella sp. PMI_491]|nr:zincin [Thozetella sp. PMI_491]